MSVENKQPIGYGYYLHKDGTPIVVFNDNSNTLPQLKKDGYKYIFPIYSEEGIMKHLSYYNSGYDTNRFNLKPFYLTKQ